MTRIHNGSGDVAAESLLYVLTSGVRTTQQGGSADFSRITAAAQIDQLRGEAIEAMAHLGDAAGQGAPSSG